MQCVGASVLGFSLSEFRLELPDPCFGCHAGFLLRVGPVPFVFERDDVLPGGRVVALQLSVFPPDEKVQDGALALEDSLCHGFDGYGFIPALHQPVSGQPGPMEVPGLVETPVFGYA